MVIRNRLPLTVSVERRTRIASGGRPITQFVHPNRPKVAIVVRLALSEMSDISVDNEITVTFYDSSL